MSLTKTNLRDLLLADCIEATFVTVFQSGYEVRMKCLYNERTNIVFDVEYCDNVLDDIDRLSWIYIELPNGKMSKPEWFHLKNKSNGRKKLQ